MSNVVGEVQVRVRPDGQDFLPELQSILNRAQNQARQGGQAIGQALNQASAGASQLGQSIDQNVGQKFANAALQAAGFTAAVYATRAAIEGTIGKLAGLFDQLAQAKAGFESIIGNRAGTALLEDIREFARVSPFVTQELVNYSQQLLGVGVAAEKIVPLLRDTGNVISSVGGDTQNLSRVLFTLTQIQTVGRLTGQDAMQLQSALIPITKMLAEYLGKTTQEVKKLQEQGAISAESVFAAISAAGQKVPGAMDKAVRNISGARAVLSDTITIMLQDAPALNRIYTDIVQGIQGFAAKLGEPEIQGNIAKALESVGKAYDALKPVVESFLSTMGSASMTGLRSFGTVMGVFADALDSMPKPVLDALGKVLAVMVTLQAPKYLMQYVQSMRTMAGLFPSLSRGLSEKITQTTADERAATRAAIANDRLANSLKNVTIAAGSQSRFGGFMQRNAGKLGGAAALGAGIAGMQLQGMDETNTVAQAAGGALTYGAMGFAVGGPAGALVGAGIGALTGFLSSSEEKARRHAETMKKLGQEAAEGFITANADALSTATAESSDILQKKLDDINQRRSEVAPLNLPMIPDLKPGQTWMNTTLEAELAAIEKAYDDLFGGVQENLLKTKGLLSDPAVASIFSKEFFNTVEGGRRGTEDVLKDWKEVEEAAKKYGLTLDEIGTMGADAIAKIIVQIAGLTTETQKAIAAAGVFNAAFEKSKGEADAIYGVRAKELTNRMSAISAERAAVEAVSKSYQNQSDLTAKMAADQAVFHAAELAYQVTKADMLAKGRTEIEATAAANIAAEQVINGTRVVAISTMQELSKQYGYTQQQLATILNLEKALDPAAKIVITADTSDALTRLAQLSAFKDAITNSGWGPLRNVGGTSSRWGPLRNVGNTIQDQIDAITNQFGYIPPPVIPPPVIAPAASKTPKSTASGPTWADKVSSAGDSLRAALEAAAEAVESAAAAWKGSIKEATQYEAAVSANRALKNTTKQISDISMITSGIATLKARGLSEAAIEALDINAITDARQIKKLLATDPGKLQALSAAVGKRDLLASTLSSDRQAEQSRKTITQAIVEAAKLLGYKVTDAQAKAISAEFNITSTLDAESVANSILSQLTGGKVAV